MRKKLFICLLAVMLVIASLCQTVFADFMDDVKQSPNAVVMVSVDNEDCLELENLKDLKVRLTCPGAGLDMTVPVEEVQMDGETMGLWLGFPSEKISDAIMNKLAEMQGELDLGELEEDPKLDMTSMEDAGDVIEDIENLLTEVEITVEGLPEGHYVVDGSAAILTHEVCKAAIDMIMEAAREEFGEVNSFSELFDKLMKQLGLDLDEVLDTSAWTQEDWEILEEMGITEADIENIKTLIANLDPLIEYITSEEFSGILIANAYLVCECPQICDYTVEHRYYERVDGKLKLVGTVNEGEKANNYYLMGTEGDIIYAEDFKQPVYQGKTYEYLGSYSDYALYDDYNWKYYRMKSLTLGDYESGSGLVLRYVYDKDGSAAAGSTAGTSGKGDGQSAPATGDEQPLGIYVLVLAAALGLAISCVTGKMTQSR
ncbi:hypothetical protein V1225_14200 [Emergencia sp. JLR.KK010]|uniref:hypothetical protein n=1 Tax=Emergencia sp. JLR.KK010 TaxID=3114296 RepID=UPI0030D169B1